MGRNSLTRVAALAAAILGAIVSPSVSRSQTLDSPGPGRIAIAANVFDAPPPGYLLEEHFVAGTANAYRAVDGAGPQASIVTDGQAPYRTRVVVARPADPARFNGTVLVEWINVTSSSDAAPDWNYLHRELARGGYAYMAVSAQKAGLDGNGVSSSGLQAVKAADPQRYGTLSHPGDAYAYDIYSQAARLLRTRTSELLGPLKPKRILAIGESQSAAFMVTYVNAVDPLARVFDGFLIHSRFRGASGLNGDFRASLDPKDAAVPIPAVKLREDVRVPTLTFIAETDLLFVSEARRNLPNAGYLAARQPDADRIRTWEVAGTAHADTYTLMGGLDDGRASPEVLARAFTPIHDLFGAPLARSINAAPQHHYVLEAALHALDNWVATGRPPPSQPRLNVEDGAEPSLVRDRWGNATGGVRTPWMDVPVAQHSGFGQEATGTLRLFGSTVPFDAAQLARLYPGGRSDYLAKFDAALDRAILAGVILPADREEIRAVAKAMYR
jgi:hypothetical protein